MHSKLMLSRNQSFVTLWNAFKAAVGRLDKSLSPKDTFTRLRKHEFTLSDSIYIFHAILAAFWLSFIPSLILKFLIPVAFAVMLLIPLTCQFFLPAIPILTWVLTFFASTFIPNEWRPNISVVLLPTLESVLFGANISDILTRFTHPVLDIIAWIPYGVGHFSIPFVIAAFIWLFRAKEALHFWSSAFGYMMLVGVLIQIIFPCAAPWYELIYGLTPANYGMKGSPGGLIRIDHMFHGSGYTISFSNAPVIFGAFPSLHAGGATMEALVVSHFFPQTTRFVWFYAGVLYWATMYLTHHYLIDVVVGACLATVTFYLFLPDNLKGPGAVAGPGELTSYVQRSKYDIYDLEAPRRTAAGDVMADAAADFDLSESSHASDDEEMDITYRSPLPGATPTSAAPFLINKGAGTVEVGRKKGHRHTASIATLIRSNERGGEDGWSSMGGNGFVIPPAPMRGARD
ncbi:PAP2-domain-containing protein [Armillaria fumosa]|nr:PAP2-domain-containing protein [Armillaria fumosa]